MQAIMGDKLNAFLARPGDYFYHTNLPRWLYKKTTSLFCQRRIALGKKLMSALPNVEHQIDAQGYLILKPHQVLNAQQNEAISAAGDLVTARQEFEGWGARDKGYDFTRNLFGKQDVTDYPQILRFGLSHEMLAIVARYLGQLPVMPSVFVWRSLPQAGEFTTSQLWHLDHSDVRQIKVFVLLHDVTLARGPLVLIPAPASQRLRRELRYNWRARRRVSDHNMSRALPPAKEIKITGKKGTMVFADTSRLFHYGCRLRDNSRYVMVYRYLTINNFVQNPFRPNPYSIFADNPAWSPVQRAVLTACR